MSFIEGPDLPKDVPKQKHNRIVPSRHNTIERTFVDSRQQWINEPVVSQWSNKDPGIAAVLQELNQLYEQWRTSGPGPFYPFSDPLWLQTCEVLRDAGLPWLNNNLHLPEDIDPSWPFQSKYFEREAVVAKGARVGDDDPSGYICNWSEGNLYAIRALQQELRRQRPSQKPLLVANRMDPQLIEAAAQAFGLETYRIHEEWDGAEEELQAITGNERPIIFAATWANDQGQSDDFEAIRRLSKTIPTVLHVDASRNFEFVTSLSDSDRRKLGIPRLVLQESSLCCSQTTDQEVTIQASTMVAAGMNCTYPPLVVTLKPRKLGASVAQKVEYLKGSDNTLCGSRDAIGPLLTYIQEQRFGSDSRREIFERCSENRQYFIGRLISEKVRFKSSDSSLDAVLYPGAEVNDGILAKLGLIRLDDGSYMATIQASVTRTDLDLLVGILQCGAIPPCTKSLQSLVMPFEEYPISEELTKHLCSIVDQWHHSAKSSGGYCLNQATYSALGPIIGRFLPVTIPTDWVRARGQELLANSRANFGLIDSEYAKFTARFTTGSTMGNRIGLHAAVSNRPNAYIYFSTSTHYSVRKIVEDDDMLIGRWSGDRRSRFVAVPADMLGRMVPEELVKQVARDKSACQSANQEHEIVLLVNIGTTFTGGRDDISALREALLHMDWNISYIHADGALDFGFSSYPVRLGPPDLATKDDLDVVQGITLSHHKAFGIMVSGEVIYYDPGGAEKVGAALDVEPRVVFETWIFQKMYSPADLARTQEYCHENARRLRKGLETLGVVTHYNADSLITVMERQPAWITHQFQLAPEGGWVHYITMPHISSVAVDEFIETLTAFEKAFSMALRTLEDALSTILGEQLTISRVKCTNPKRFLEIFAFCRDVVLDTHRTSRDLNILDFDKFEQCFGHGATSFMALRSSGEPLFAFLSTTHLEGSVGSWPVLICHEFQGKGPALEILRTEYVDYLSKSLGIAIMRMEW